MDRKKKAILWGVLACVLLAVAVCAAVYWYHTPGAHVFANRLRVELDTECYIVNPVTGEVVGKSRISLNTSTELFSSETTGSALVEGYPIEGSLVSTCDKKLLGNAELVYYHGIIFYADTNGNAAADFSEICYSVYFDPVLQDTVVLILLSTPGSDNLCAVYAQSPNEAIEKCQQFWKNLASK